MVLLKFGTIFGDGNIIFVQITTRVEGVTAKRDQPVEKNWSTKHHKQCVGALRAESNG